MAFMLSAYRWQAKHAAKKVRGKQIRTFDERPRRQYCVRTLVCFVRRQGSLTLVQTATAIADCLEVQPCIDLDD